MGNMASADHDAFCSAPPLVLPPRPCRAQEARRPRAPIWTGIREASEVEFGLDANDAIEVKPDVGKQPIRVQVCAIRPAAASTASSPDAQRHPLPSYRARIASVAIRPAPPRQAASNPKCQAPESTPGVGPGSGVTSRKPGRPPGSKSRPRIAAVATSSSPPPVRQAAKASQAKTRDSLSRR